jgi:hypothetical protein
LLLIFVGIILLNVNLSYSGTAVAQPPVQTLLYYPPLDWYYINNEYRTIFFPPNFATDSALILVDSPADVSGYDQQTLNELVMGIISQKDGFTLLNASVLGDDPENSVLMVEYRFNAPFNATSSGLLQGFETHHRIGDQLISFTYLAEPNSFFLYWPTFLEMITTYGFVPTTPTPTYSPTYPAEVNPENACFLGEDVSILSCLDENATFTRQESAAIGGVLNLYPPPLS